MLREHKLKTLWFRQNLNYFLDQTFPGAINRLTRKLKNGKKKNCNFLNIRRRKLFFEVPLFISTKKKSFLVSKTKVGTLPRSNQSII